MNKSCIVSIIKKYSWQLFGFTNPVFNSGTLNYRFCPPGPLANQTVAYMWRLKNKCLISKLISITSPGSLVQICWRITSPSYFPSTSSLLSLCHDELKATNNVYRMFSSTTKNNRKKNKNKVSSLYHIHTITTYTYTPLLSLPHIHITTHTITTYTYSPLPYTHHYHTHHYPPHTITIYTPLPHIQQYHTHPNTI